MGGHLAWPCGVRGHPRCLDASPTDSAPRSPRAGPFLVVQWGAVHSSCGTFEPWVVDQGPRRRQGEIADGTWPCRSFHRWPARWTDRGGACAGVWTTTGDPADTGQIRMGLCPRWRTMARREPALPAYVPVARAPDPLELSQVGRSSQQLRGRIDPHSAAPLPCPHERRASAPCSLTGCLAPLRGEAACTVRRGLREPRSPRG